MLYDQLEDRWLLSQFTTRGPKDYDCVAISQTGDPTGAYYRYAFVTQDDPELPGGTFFPDYPKYGVWTKSYIMTTRDFGDQTGYGISVYALEKNKMLAGNPKARAVQLSTFPSEAIGQQELLMPIPLRMLQVLVTRKNPYEKNNDEPLGDPISLEDAIRVMTLGGAYSMRKEIEFGSIEKGKGADMVVLNRNLFEIDPETIIDTEVVYTIFAGKIVYDAKMQK